MDIGQAGQTKLLKEASALIFFYIRVDTVYLLFYYIIKRHETRACSK